MMVILPEETLIVEDSPYGLLAAYRSKSHVLRVNNPQEVTYTNIFKKLTQIEMGITNDKPKWVDKKLNVLIPMAGAGSRFATSWIYIPKTTY
jgi:beta-phosphoglucomutase-like phosphatase (HAD superfamily)